MEEKCTYIDEIVVQTPHDAVSEFIERLRASQAVGEEDTPNNDAIEPPTLQLTTRYASPKTEKEIAEARENSVPLSTRRDTVWCLGVWKDWSCARNSRPYTKSKVPSNPASCTSHISLSHWLEAFVLEVRTKHGKEYSPDTLHHLICGILRYVRETSMPTVDFFKDHEYGNFRKTLDSEMKRIRRTGKGSSKKKAEPLTNHDEEKLWESGLLGDHSPNALLNTIFYMCGLFFALRSGAEHRCLRLNPPQITVHQSKEGTYLLYVEDASKNHQGGLKGRKVSSKQVKHFENVENPYKCFVRLFQLYLSKLPQDCPKNAFYFKPLQKYSANGVWFSKQPLGHNKLHKMMSSICSAAGISGYKTNHSLRATSASRLYQTGIDEQLIMERTGHRSIEGVRSYKITNVDQEKAVSNILQQADSHHQPCGTTGTINQLTSKTTFNHTKNFPSHSALPNINIKDCTQITFNFHY